MFSQHDDPSATSTPQSGSGWSRWHSLSIERKLPLVIVVLLAVMLTTTVVVTHRVLTRSAEKSTRDRLTSAVRLITNSAEVSLQQRAAALREVAASPALHALLAAGAAATPAQRESAQQALRAQGLTSSRLRVELRNHAGELVAHDGAEPDPAILPPRPVDDSVMHSPLHAEGGVVHSWTVLRVRRGNTVLGYIAAELQIGGPPAAVEMVRGLTGEDVSIYVRNADHSVYAHHPGVEVAPPQSRTRRGEVIRHDRAGGGRMIVGEAVVSGTPWLMVLEAPLAPVLARAVPPVTSLAIVSALLMLIGTVVAWLLSRRITRPLISLTRAAEALAAGDYTRRVGVRGTDELGRLGTSFNGMAEQIESARRELMQRVREAQDARLEAERLHEVTEHAREQSERANRAKSDFLAVMSHELRTPLNAIGGYAQLLELGVHGPLTEPQLDALRRIERNQEHLLTLINDVLNYAKLDVGAVQFKIEDVPVGEVFQNIEPLIAPQVQMHRLRFVQQKPDDGLAVRADADKLQQILLNLLGNALKFTPAGGTITLECTGRDSVVQIHVRDTGVGIPADRLEAIFEPFYQGDRALNRPTDGVGLGLAISRDLARGMAGELDVESAVGRGSVFTVILPLARTGSGE